MTGQPKCKKCFDTGFLTFTTATGGVDPCPDCTPKPLAIHEIMDASQDVVTEPESRTRDYTRRMTADVDKVIAGDDPTKRAHDLLDKTYCSRRLIQGADNLHSAHAAIDVAVKSAEERGYQSGIEDCTRERNLNEPGMKQRAAADMRERIATGLTKWYGSRKTISVGEADEFIRNVPLKADDDDADNPQTLEETDKIVDMLMEHLSKMSPQKRRAVMLRADRLTRKL